MGGTFFALFYDTQMLVINPITSGMESRSIGGLINLALRFKMYLKGGFAADVVWRCLLMEKSADVVCAKSGFRRRKC